MNQIQSQNRRSTGGIVAIVVLVLLSVTTCILGFSGLANEGLPGATNPAPQVSVNPPTTNQVAEKGLELGLIAWIASVAGTTARDGAIILNALASILALFGTIIVLAQSGVKGESFIKVAIIMAFAVSAVTTYMTSQYIGQVWLTLGWLVLICAEWGLSGKSSERTEYDPDTGNLTAQQKEKAAGFFNH